MAERQPGYEYRGMLASAWDLLRGDTSSWPDRAFYRDVIRSSGQPALDVGCGTGRLILDYLTDGVDVDGADLSPEMLAICREKVSRLGLQPTLYEQAMESLELPRRYRTIFVPSSSFQLLTDREAAVRAMARFRDHLAPGGTLVMPFMVMWSEQRAAREPDDPWEWHVHQERERPEDGALVRRWQRSRCDLAEQLEHTEGRYEVIVDGEVFATEHHGRSPAARWYTQEQALALYRDAGLGDVHATRGFTFEPARGDEEMFCVFGVRE